MYPANETNRFGVSPLSIQTSMTVVRIITRLSKHRIFFFNNSLKFFFPMLINKTKTIQSEFTFNRELQCNLILVNKAIRLEWNHKKSAVRILYNPQFSIIPRPLNKGSFFVETRDRSKKTCNISQTFNIIVSYANYIAIESPKGIYYLSFNNDLLFSISAVLNQPPQCSLSIRRLSKCINVSKEVKGTTTQKTLTWVRNWKLWSV